MTEGDLESIQVQLSGNANDWPAAKIRSTFIDFFAKKKDHTFWPSSPVVPLNDPTLLFINAGMNQFKPLFLGTCDPSLEMSKLKMAVNSQKCIRAGGKHNDLEDVGKDVYHHTFFEMLGNWSFGCYFKEEAITWAWECLINEFHLNPERLYATYFGGDEALGLAPDLEAKSIWMRFLPENRILPFGCKDNFWEMGATGPCGPCTEIHYDRIGGRDAASLVNADRPDVIEIWNNVFIQFNREADGSLKELPSKHVDTGMGFERLASILQGKDSNYDTDIFEPIFNAIQSVSGCRPYSGKLGPEDVGLVDMAYRVVADHIRTLVFAITDGAVPSNDGRGYVLRRILRRAVRYGQEMLGAPNGFFAKLVPTVVKNFSAAFSELASRQEFVTNIITDEEQSFNRTLDQGVKHFKKVIAGLEGGADKVVSAKEAHFLFSSMGFPLDLTELMAAERGFTVDKAGFEELMENDRKISEAAEMLRKGGSTKDMSMEAEQTSWLQTAKIDATDNELKYTWNIQPEATIQAIYIGKGGSSAGFVNEISEADGLVGIIVNKSPFYYESGGQVFDTGVIETVNGSVKFTVSNVQAYAGYSVHVGTVEGSGKIVVGDAALMKVDYSRRSYVAPNHTMTHVLNYALREVLVLSNSANENGVNQCDQRGSLVDADKLRFDFSWNAALTSAQVERVEVIVNERIEQQLPVHTKVVPLADATQIYSLRKVFGETYPDPVRVVCVGTSVEALIENPNNTKWSDMSIEFCGGTHISNTSSAEHFVIVEESGIAKGIRRIVGLTRDAAKAARAKAAELTSKLQQLESLPGGSELSSKYKLIKVEIDQALVSLVDKDRLRAKLNTIYEVIRNYNKANVANRLNAAMSVAEKLGADAVQSNKDAIVASVDIGADGKVAKKIQEKLRALHARGSFFLVSIDDDGEKIGCYPAVSTEHIAVGINAKEWVDFVISKVGAGKGGGKADQANGSIPGDAETVDKILSFATEYLNNRISSLVFKTA